MQLAVENTMKEHNAPSAIELYNLKGGTFVKYMVAILSRAGEALDEGFREIHEPMVGRCYVDARGQWLATTTRQQAEALKRL